MAGAQSAVGAVYPNHVSEACTWTTFYICPYVQASWQVECKQQLYQFFPNDVRYHVVVYLL